MSFLFVITMVIFFSKKELGIVLSIGAIIFGLLTNVNILESLIAVYTDLSVILLAIAITLIPILGGIMEKSGLMLELIKKLNISKKTALMVSPALFGLLPVPGGALMSAPIVDQLDSTLNPNSKIGINVWYRHALILIYPLSSSLIVGSILSGISLYAIIIAMLIPFFCMIFIGFITFIKPISDEKDTNDRNLKVVFRNLFPLILAPLVDFFGRIFFPFVYPEIFLLIGLCLSIWIALKFSKLSLSIFKEINQKMHLWRFPLLIFAMFFFLEVFKKSGVPEEISGLQLPFIVFIFFSFFLGFATGRVQLPISILIPIYLIQYALTTMPLLDFVFTYYAIFLGYLITPLHPCLSYNTQYFKTSYKNAVKVLSLPTFLCFGILLAIYLIIAIFVSFF